MMGNFEERVYGIVYDGGPILVEDLVEEIGEPWCGVYHVEHTARKSDRLVLDENRMSQYNVVKVS